MMSEKNSNNKGTGIRQEYSLGKMTATLTSAPLTQEDERRLVLEIEAVLSNLLAAIEKE